ncbi:hypothetical protein M1545_02980 [Patescibacteria group bacterium]|nr:hypothetical protein [Patescibacteria group bacterium]
MKALEKLYYFTLYIWLFGVLVSIVSTLIVVLVPLINYQLHLPYSDIGLFIISLGFTGHFLAVQLLIAQGDIDKGRISLLAALMVINTPILLFQFAGISERWILTNAGLLIILGIEYFVPNWPQKITGGFK